jgi:hypothetical protein
VKVRTDLKQWTLGIVESSRQEIQTLIQHIPIKERKAVGQLKAWSAKDEMAHLMFWLGILAQNIANKRQGKPLISTKDYRAMNDEAWNTHKDFRWAEVEEALTQALVDIEKQVKTLTLEELSNGKTFFLESSGSPLVRSLLYELVDHPLHHVVKLYKKFGQDKDAAAALERLTSALTQPGVSKWTATSRGKIKKFETLLQT